MSLATDLTQCQQRLADAGRKASAQCRRLRGVAPVEIYEELMLELCVFASETNQLKALLGALRMTGELEQRPPPVTAESLELFQDARSMEPGTREQFIKSLHRCGDHSLDEEPDSLFHGREAS